jgi:hypothetical protein
VKTIFGENTARFFSRWCSASNTSYINSEAVIPEKAGIQEKTGFRVKPGMTIKVKGLLTQYATAAFDCAQDSLLRITERENRLK